MGQITDINITGRLSNGQLGDAHELLVTGILMRLGFDVSVASVKGGAYDVLIGAQRSSNSKKKFWIRGQVKTAEKSVSFVAGSRGGVNRIYKSGVKTYKYTTKHNDIIIAVDKENLDLYLIPTIFIQMWGKSKSLGKIPLLKNNWDILLNWNPGYLKKLEVELGKV